MILEVKMTRVLGSGWGLALLNAGGCALCALGVEQGETTVLGKTGMKGLLGSRVTWYGAGCLARWFGRGSSNGRGSGCAREGNLGAVMGC